MPSHLFVLGARRRSASNQVRDRLHVEPADLYEGLRQLKGLGELLESAVPLATCERLEVYAVAEDPERAVRVLERAVARYTGVPPAEVMASRYLHTGEDAVRHLFRVAAGLDSAIIGEAQILGQVRSALGHPGTGEVADSFLRRLFQSALAAGKRVRSETGIGRGAASVAGSALHLLDALIPRWSDRTALVLGAGGTGTLVAKLLRQKGVGRLLIANRTLSRAQAVAEEFGGEAYALGDLGELLGHADLVVGTVAERTDLVTLRQLEDRIATDDRPLHLIDLAHPRNFDPAVAKLERVQLIDLAHVFAEAESVREERAAEAPRAESIVEAEVENFRDWVRSRESAPVLRAMREQVLAMAQAEADRRARGRPPGEREEFARLARSVARTILHGPTLAIRQADPETAEGRRILKSIPDLFGVEIDR